LYKACYDSVKQSEELKFTEDGSVFRSSNDFKGSWIYNYETCDVVIDLGLIKTARFVPDTQSLVIQESDGEESRLTKVGSGIESFCETFDKPLVPAEGCTDELDLTQAYKFCDDD
jgi:hypothetical protein